MTTFMHNDPYDAWRWAEELFGRRDYIGAAKALEGLLENDENPQYHFQVRELLARAYYHSARLTPAAELTRALLEEQPDNGYLALLMSRTLERQNKKDEAEAYRRRAETLGHSA